MESALLLRGARQLLTLRGPAGPRRGPALAELGIIEDGAVLIREGRLVCVGPSRRLENLREARQAEAFDASGKVVTPGFVDAHLRLVAGRVLPGPGEPLLVAGRSPARALTAGVSRRRLELELRRRIGHLARHGTTALEIECVLGPDESSTLRLLRVLACLRGDPLDVVPSLVFGSVEPQQPPGSIESLLDRLLPALRERRLIRFLGAYGQPGWPDLEQLRACLLRAKELGLGLKVHGALSPELVCLARELGAASIGALGGLGAEEIRMLAASPLIVTLFPAAALSASRVCAPPVRELIAAGAAVSLASGYGVAGPTYSMLAVVSLACWHLEMTPAEAIVAATINAACSLGLGQQLGSLEPGKLADLVVFDAPDYREIPYHLGVNLVNAVLKRGRVIYRRGEVSCRDD